MDSKNTLGLSMIVKNESKVILRLLNSVFPIIDYWVIADTGSTDGTQKIIQDFFDEKGIPGKLLQIDWRDDFSYARNKSLEEIEKHVDYGFWIDADEELVIDNFDKQKLLDKSYQSAQIKTIYGRIDYTRKNIWKTGMNFKWQGPIHELLSSPDETETTVANGLTIIVRPEGHSWSNIKEKYLSHARILEKHANETKEARWVFYTAQSYRDAQDFNKSIEWYKKRAEMKDGFFEEIFVSKLMIAKLSEILGKDKNECTMLFQDAHSSDPFRGEAIKGLVQMYQRLGDWENAYVFSLYGLRYNKKSPYPQRVLFLDKGLYDYEMLELHALSCFYTNRKEEGTKCYWEMRHQLETLGEHYLSPEAKKRVLSNEKYYPLTNSMHMFANKVHKKHIPNKPKKKRRK